MLPVVNLLMMGPLVYLNQRGFLSDAVADCVALPFEFAERHDVFEKLGIENTLQEYMLWWARKAGGAKEPVEPKVGKKI